MAMPIRVPQLQAPVVQPAGGPNLGLLLKIFQLATAKGKAPSGDKSATGGGLPASGVMMSGMVREPLSVTSPSVVGSVNPADPAYQQLLRALLGSAGVSPPRNPGMEGITALAPNVAATGGSGGLDPSTLASLAMAVGGK